MFCATASSYLALLTSGLCLCGLTVLCCFLCLGLGLPFRAWGDDRAYFISSSLLLQLCSASCHASENYFVRCCSSQREKLQEQLIPDHKQNCLILVISIECSGHLLDLFHFCFCRCQTKFKHTCQWCMCVSLGTCHGFRKLCKRPGCT